jgi:hypothetical protein
MGGAPSLRYIQEAVISRTDARSKRGSKTPRKAKARRLRAVAGVWSRIRERFPLTNLGLVLAALAYLAWMWARVPGAEIDKGRGFFALLPGRADYVVELVALLVGALVLIAVIAASLGALIVHRAFKKGAMDSEDILTFEAQRGFLSFLKMPGFRWLPLLEVHWSWEDPDGFFVDLAEIEGRLMENVETFSRNVTDRIVRRFVIEDGFGLARIVLRRTQRRGVRVLPWTGKLETSPMLRSLSGGDDVPHPFGPPTGDRVDMRRYVPGDPLRLALWKVYARTGELMVRTPERAIMPAVRVVAYLPAAIGDEPAAAAARVAVERGLLGDQWVLSADGANHPASDVDGALSIISASRRARSTDSGDAAGLKVFLETVTQNEPVRIVLFVPARSGPWLEQVTGVAKKYGSSVSAVIVTDGVIDPDPEPKMRLDRLLKLPEESDDEERVLARAEEIGEVSRSLSAAGAGVIALERPTGRAVPLGAHPASPILRTSGGSRRVA